ncbi:hypothetical protein GGX14DRAFT_387906 [Mycena pura]|uniref:Uncharacterized protein n=1 Tax=Mycena pura TaxID=153505 RepID=A0AAD7E1I8_9AGAR|nr:hypothetical protein GGX14DRAFT_387906 [Mycena pura]
MWYFSAQPKIRHHERSTCGDKLQKRREPLMKKRKQKANADKDIARNQPCAILSSQVNEPRDACAGRTVTYGAIGAAALGFCKNENAKIRVGNEKACSKGGRMRIYRRQMHKLSDRTGEGCYIPAVPSVLPAQGAVVRLAGRRGRAPGCRKAWVTGGETSVVRWARRLRMTRQAMATMARTTIKMQTKNIGLSEGREKRTIAVRRSPRTDYWDLAADGEADVGSGLVHVVIGFVHVVVVFVHVVMVDDTGARGNDTGARGSAGRKNYDSIEGKCFGTEGHREQGANGGEFAGDRSTDTFKFMSSCFESDDAFGVIWSKETPSRTFALVM